MVSFIKKITEINFQSLEMSITSLIIEIFSIVKKENEADDV